MNDFSHSKGSNIPIIVLTLFVVLSLSLLWLTPSANAGPPFQPPRPTPGAPPGGGPGVGEGDVGGEPGELPGTTIHGLVVNWGYQNEPYVKVRLEGEGWDLETTSDDNGYYYFKGLSSDTVLLNLALPEDSDLTPLITDLALRPKGIGQLVVNLGLYAGSTTPTLPVEMSMSVEPEVVGPGSVVVYTIRATNRLAHGISQVLVTDYLPAGLVPIEATVSHSTVEIWDNLVIADVGEMAVGDTAVITIEARVEDNVVPGTVIHNRVSFIYAESVTAQAQASLTIGGARPVGTPVSPPPAEQTPTVAAALTEAETPTVVVTPTVTAAPESPGDLPVTGFGLPLAGVLFALLVLIAKLLRPKPVDGT
jgi:uncharacterized repeat protein (TIGR01451 family)